MQDKFDGLRVTQDRMDSQDAVLAHQLKQKNDQTRLMQEQEVQRERVIIQDARAAFRDNRRRQDNIEQRGSK